VAIGYTGDGQGPTAHGALFFVPLLREPLWRRAGLSEYASAHGPARSGRLAGSLYVVGPPGAAGGGISAPLAAGDGNQTHASGHNRRADREATARSRTINRQLCGRAHREARG